MPLKSRLLKPKMKRHADSDPTSAPMATLTTSEYWSRSPPHVLRQEISQRLGSPGAMEEVANAISRERLEFKILWNSSLPINQLPYELLVQIFICVHRSPYSDCRYSMIWTMPDLLKLMGTCRRWRDTIIETPAFWSVVSLAYLNTDWTGLCLARSLETPLDVWARAPEWCHPDRLEVAYSLVHRIRSLHFAADTQLNVDIPECDWPFRVLFGREIPSMPSLETLEFAVRDGGGPRAPNRFPIDVDLTLTHLPRLRSLTLSGMVSPRDTALYVDLHTLSLTTCSHSLSIDQFLDTLALCTRLESLSLMETLDRFSDDWKQHDRAPRRPLIWFPRLDTFMIRGHGAVCTSRFLEHVHIRSSARIYVRADVDARSPDGAFALAGWLPSSHALTLEPLATVTDIRLCMLARPGSKSVFIDTKRTSKMTVEASVSMDVALTVMDGVFRDPGYAPSDYGQGSVRELVEFLGRSPLTSLNIVNVLPDAVASWAGVFRTFPLLERLSVESVWGRGHTLGIENVFLGLHAASTTTTTTDPGLPEALGLACPNLKDISIYGSGSPPAYEAIRTCVAYRGSRGVVLERLHLDLFRMNLPPAVCHACAIKDIVGCTRRLEPVATNAHGAEELAVLEAAESDPARQGDAQIAALFNSGCVAATCTLHCARASESPREESIGQESSKSALRRLGGVFGRHVKLHRKAKSM